MTFTGLFLKDTDKQPDEEVQRAGSEGFPTQEQACENGHQFGSSSNAVIQELL